MEDFETEGGEDEGQIALEALKEMRGVLRAAMSRMPSAAAEEEPEAAPEAAMEAEDPMLEAAEAESIEEAPIAEKKTVLSVLTPKYGGDSSGPPPPPMGKLKAKKKGF